MMHSPIDIRNEGQHPGGGKKLYVKNFPKEMDVKGLHMMFEKFGSITSVEIKNVSYDCKIEWGTTEN